MKELEFIETIKNTLSYPKFLGDDCAFLEDLDIFVTQDSLIEDVHFSLKTTNSYLLGRKSVAVNLSDLAASLSEPKYITVSLSLPKNINSDFVKEFYRGINDICNEYKVKVAGGDITRSDKVFISICAIGKKVSKFITSRSFAKEGDLIITTGNYGTSACGLFCLQNSLIENKAVIQAHINPIPKIQEGIEISKIIDRNIAVMDTSDGLMDAIFKISQDSRCKIEIDFDSIPIKKEIIRIAEENNKDYKNWVLWGGEDYELVACISEEHYKKLNSNTFKVIGKVTEENTDSEVSLKVNSENIIITKEIFGNKSFNHFEGIQ